jgi:hypothetical protein
MTGCVQQHFLTKEFHPPLQCLFLEDEIVLKLEGTTKTEFRQLLGHYYFNNHCKTVLL